MNRIDSLLWVALVLPLASCRMGGETTRIEKVSGPLRIVADVDPTPRKFRETELALYGHLTVSNLSDRAALFGNSCLMLSVAPELRARTYKDTVASEDIDFALVTVGPGKSLSEPVYWVFSAAPEVATVELSYVCAVRHE